MTLDRERKLVRDRSPLDRGSKNTFTVKPHSKGADKKPTEVKGKK